MCQKNTKPIEKSTILIFIQQYKKIQNCSTICHTGVPSIRTVTRETLVWHSVDHRLQMSSLELNTDLKTPGKVDIALTSRKWDGPNFLCDYLLQLWDASRPILVHIVFEISPKVKFYGAQIRAMWGPLHTEVPANHFLIEVARHPLTGLVCGGRGRPILLKSLLFSLKAYPATQNPFSTLI